MQAQPSELLDIREAAAFLRVSETSLRRWTNAGRLPCLRIGGRRERRFRRADLLAFLARSEPALGPNAPTHFCGLYSSDLGRVQAAAAFLETGLQPGVLCLLLATEDVRHAVIEVLERNRPSLRGDIETGTLVLTEYRVSAAAQLADYRARVAAAIEAGISRVHVVGDVSGGGLGRLPFAEILEYETEYSRAIAGSFPVTTLCQYDARTMSGLDAARLLQCHDGTPYRSQH